MLAIKAVDIIYDNAKIKSNYIHWKIIFRPNSPSGSGLYLIYLDLP